MEDLFKIYLNSIQDGGEERIALSAPPTFLDVAETELSFTQQVEVSGKGYLANDNLILQCKVKTSASLPCAICNKMVSVEISIDDWIHAEPVKQIRGGIFDFAPVLREAILLEVPQTAECDGGHCPEREHLAKYFSKQQ